MPAKRPRSGREADEEEESRKDSPSVKKTKQYSGSSSSSDNDENSNSRGKGQLVGQPASFHVASYNVWTGTSKDMWVRNCTMEEQVCPRQRMEAICKELEEKCILPYDDPEGLLLIAFQELTPQFIRYFRSRLKAMGFVFCTQRMRDRNPPYGVGLAISRQLSVVQCQFLPFPESRQGRGLLWVETPIMLFGSVHLESFSKRTFGAANSGAISKKAGYGNTERELQIQLATSFFDERMQENPQLQLAMIAGDFNWDDEQDPKRHHVLQNQSLASIVPEGWKEATMVLAGENEEDAYTYDGRSNPMLANTLRGRFDRCLYRSSAGIKVSSAELSKLGTQPIPGLRAKVRSNALKPILPSDHYGVAVNFEVTKVEMEEME